MENITIKRSVLIQLPASAVWKAITDPDTIKKYFFETDVDTNWKEGSPITYSGTWKGKEYQDKGVIQEVKKEKLLRHTYWSSLAGKADTPENYFTITYELQPKEGATQLTVTQSGLMDQETADHSAKNWELVLQKLQELLETENQQVS